MQGSLGTRAIFKFPTPKRIFDVFVFVVRPETREFVGQQKVDDFFEAQAGQLYGPGKPGTFSSVSLTVVFMFVRAID